KDGKEVEKTNFENKNSFSYKAEKEGNYQVTVTVKDSYGNEVSKTADEFVIEKEEEVVTGEISLSVDKDKVTKKGEIVTVTINAKDIQNIAGYQVNLKYDPKVLEPVTDNGTAYSKRTFPTNGTLINNNSYSSVQAVANDLDNGILNFGKTYVYLDKYRASGVGESTGTIAIIKFKVLDVKPTTISFEDTASMPGAVDGTLMFNWNGDKTTSYTVSKSVSIDAEEEEEVIGEISLSADKDKVTKKGEIVTVTINAKDIQNIAGYQVNLKYDPKVLEPVTDNGTAYSKRTFPTNGTLINNNSYSSVQAVANDLDNGILNFGKTYVYLDKYRASGVGESTGTIAIIKFKVLDVKPTTISFEDTASMPGAVDGTLMFNWNGDKTTSYTVVKSLSIDAEEEVIIVKPEIVSVKADKTSPQLEGTTITWTCEATGENLEYAWLVKKDGKEVEKTNFASNNSFSYKAEEKGNYQATVTVKDSYGNEVSKESDTFVIEEKNKSLKV
ncbi:MAG TPA: cohesin domain-containing protein, partial [Defluviitaleaceae bacterium]|nr:cohesin domain-containing protein [Defluviitaleaceae bacterium]